MEKLPLDVTQNRIMDIAESEEGLVFIYSLYKATLDFEKLVSVGVPFTKIGLLSEHKIKRFVGCLFDTGMCKTVKYDKESGGASGIRVIMPILKEALYPLIPDIRDKLRIVGKLGLFETGETLKPIDLPPFYIGKSIESEKG